MASRNIKIKVDVENLSRVKQEMEKLKQENEKLYSLINRMQKYFAPTSGEWQFVEVSLNKIKGE